MAGYKNSIMLGIALESQNDVKGRLTTLIEGLNNQKIVLDLTLKDNTIVQTLEKLNNILDATKQKMGGDISLGNVNTVINEAINGIEKLNGQLQKQSTTNFLDGTSKVIKTTSEGIGQIRRELESLDKNGNIMPTEQRSTTTTNYANIRKAINDIAIAKESLDKLMANGLIDKNKIADLQTMMNPRVIGSDNELKSLLNQVKQLEVEEKNLQKIQAEGESLYKQHEAEKTRTAQQESEKRKQLEQKVDNTWQKILYENEIKLANQMADGREKAEQKKQEAINKTKQAEMNSMNNNSNQAYSQLLNLQKEEYDIKQKLITAEGQYKAKLEESLIANRLLQTEQNKNIKDNGLTNKEKEIELTNQQLKLQDQLNQVKAKNNDSNINTLTKQIQEAQTQLEKMKQTFGNKLPNGYIESTQSALNKLLVDLKNVDGVNFNAIKNSLGQIKSSMEQTNNETKQLTNSLKEAGNSGFFSNMSNFLGQIGVFYGIQQVVQGITNQLKEASQYTIEMDKAFTNMQMITMQSKEEISGLVGEYKNLGAQLHTTNTDMMGGMEEISRAGIRGDEGESLMASAIMGSKISGQTTKDTTNQLIAIKNAFNMTGESMQSVVDMMSRMDNTSATSFRELAEALRYTSFSAQEAGTPLSNLVAYITTVSEKTRKSASTIGESFKTIYSRYSNIKLGRLDDDGKSINDTEFAMRRIGIEIRSSKGEFKQFDVVLNEFMAKYKSGQINQVDYLAGIQALAGTRQRETLMSLIENMDSLNIHQKDVIESTGSAKKMFDEAYSPSLEARINDLKRAMEDFYERIMNSDGLKTLVGSLTGLVNTFGNVPTIVGLATSALLLFKGQAILGAIAGISSYIKIIGIASKEVGILKLASIELNAVMTKNPFGLLAVAIMTAVVAMDLFGTSAEESKKAQEEAIANYTTQKEEVGKANELLKQKIDLEEQINSTNEGTKENKELKEQLIEVERNLAIALPSSTTGYDSQGIAIATNNELIQKQIDLKKQASVEDLKTQLKNNDTKFDGGGSKDIESALKTLEDAKAYKEKLQADINEMNISGKTYISRKKENGLGNEIIQLGNVKRSYAQVSEEIDSLSSKTASSSLIIMQLKDAGLSYKDIATYIGTTEDAIKSYDMSLQSTSTKTTKSADSIKTVKNAIAELDQTTKVSDITIKSLNESFPNLGITTDNATAKITKFKTEIASSSGLISEAQKELIGLGTGGKLSEATISKLNSAMPSLGINANNANNIIGKLAKSTEQAGGSAEQTAKKFEALGDTFSGFGSEAKVIDDIMEQMKEYGGVSESTYSTIISKYPELLALMSDESTMTEKLTGKKADLIKQQEAVKNQAIINAQLMKENAQAIEDTGTATDGLTQKLIANGESTEGLSEKVSSLYGEYEVLSSQENLSGEQKARLGDITNELKGHVEGLTVSIGENGVAHIDNIEKVQSSVGMLEIENTTILTLTNTRWEDNKATSEWSINNQNMTYTEVTNNIANYKAEIQALGQLMNAKMLNASQTASSNMGGQAYGSEMVVADNANAENAKKVSEASAQLRTLESAKAKIDAISANMGGGTSAPRTVSSGGGGKSGGSGKSDADKTAEKAEKLAEDIAKMQAIFDPDPYFELNNAIKEYDNELEINKTLLDSLTEGSAEYQKTQLAQIEIDKKKQVGLQNLNDEQKKQAQALKDYLAQYGFTTDAIGNLNNSQSQIEYWEGITNSLGGNTEEEKAKKQEWIDWISELSKKTNDYTSLVNDKIPSVANQWNTVGNEIKKTTEAIKKANEDTYNSFRDELVADYLKEQQDKVDALKEQAKKADEDSLKSIEDEKTATISAYDAQIKSLQDKLNALDDESADNEKKLAKLKAERKLWLKDTSVFSKSKIDGLDTQIAETEKAIQKDSLQKQIDALNKKKQAESDSYDESKTKLEKSNSEKEDINEATYKDMLDEKKAYAKADQMISSKSQAEMIALLKKYDTSYKDVGKQLSSSLTDPFIEKIKSVEEAWIKLSAKIGSSDTSSSTGNSSSFMSDNSGVFVAKNGDHVWIEDGSTDEIYSDASHNNSKGTAWSNGVASADELIATGYENGFMRISDKNGHDLGYVENSKLKKFATGGRIGKVGSQGVPIIADDHEMIANAGDTKKFDEMYNYIANSGGLLTQLSNQYSKLGNYTMPSLGTDLNSLTNGVTNNSNTNNTNSQSITMPVTIINEKGAEQFTEQKLYKTMDKWQKEQGRRYK